MLHRRTLLVRAIAAALAAASGAAWAQAAYPSKPVRLAAQIAAEFEVYKKVVVAQKLTLD